MKKLNFLIAMVIVVLLAVWIGTLQLGVIGIFLGFLIGAAGAILSQLLPNIRR